jgi:UV excision repair protein RAD23
MLQTVLTQIGQQQPDLLQEINANQALFLEMMNEPVADNAPAPGNAPAAPSGAGGMSSMLGGADPQQLAQMLQNMSPEEMNQMAAMMGISPEQLQATARMMQQIPPEQLNQLMAQAMGAGGPGAGMMGGGGGGPQVLRLTPEEMEAVDRLTAMGFDRTEAAQAFLACDKNEALAANLLMDSMDQDGGGFGFGDDSGGGGGGNDPAGGGSGGGSNENNDGEDMYD